MQHLQLDSDVVWSEYDALTHIDDLSLEQPHILHADLQLDIDL